VLGETADRDAAPLSPQPADARIPRSAQAAALLAVRAGRGTTASGSDRIGAETLAGYPFTPFELYREEGPIPFERAKLPTPGERA
jgi:hypothetical protein